MMESFARTTFAALAVAAVAFAPSHVNAQEDALELQQECTAQVSPAQVEAGAAAVMVSVTLSEDIGAVERVEAVGSGITEASSDDIPRTEMATDEEAPKSILEGAAANTWTVWLNTTDAEAGTYPVTFVTTEGTTCTADLEIVG